MAMEALWLEEAVLAGKARTNGYEGMEVLRFAVRV